MLGLSLLYVIAVQLHPKFPYYQQFFLPEAAIDEPLDEVEDHQPQHRLLQKWVQKLVLWPFSV